MHSSLLTLEPFVKHRAYTLWRVEPHKTDPSKVLKVPVHYDGVTHHDLGNEKTGRPANPAPPLTATEAADWLAHHHAAGTGHQRVGEVGYLGAGFRPEGTGLVCVDLDDCVTAAGWTPGALALMGRLPGALIEQSVSGRGAHLWVTVQGAGPGRCGKKVTPLGSVEVYGSGQFIACGTVLGGDAATDHTAGVARLVADYWPPIATTDRAAAPADWELKTPEARAAALAELRSALLAGWDPDNRDDWQRAGHALSTLDEMGYALWAEWSATSKRFPGGDGLDKWDSFRAERTDYRSIFAQAQRNGWTNPAQRPELPSDAAMVFEAGAPVVGAAPAGMLLEPPPGVPAVASDLSFIAAAQGLIASTVATIETALSSEESGVKIAYDSFKDRISISVAGAPWRPLRDTDYGRLRAAFERRGFKPVPAEAMSTAVAMVAESNSFDSATQWAEGLVWDGVERLPTMMPRFYGTDDTAYTRAAGLYLFTALAGRALVPGIKADMAVIMVGLQGAMKTSSIEVLCPEPEAFGEVDLNKRDTDLARQLRGKLVVEMAELNGLAGRDQEAIKAWISRRKEEWTPKYKEMAIAYWRRCVLIGTDNKGEFLDDPTGARRFLPLHVKAVDVVGLAAVRDQLWAEGVTRFKRSGIAWQDAERLARDEHHKFEVVDELASVIHNFMESPPTPKIGEPLVTEPRSAHPIRGADILTGALNMKFGDIKKSDEQRLGKIMRKLGYQRDTQRVNGVPAKIWIKVVTQVVTR